MRLFFFAVAFNKVSREVRICPIVSKALKSATQLQFNSIITAKCINIHLIVERTTEINNA